ncbi:hypothetical protein [Ferrimonas senticii]|uniref:hypothetical protein n=1 Tax=Ferrimonas senticii TaxID=394566 RepID=UPI0003FEDD6D|nr:hypothetical protein [Ferrimonas senticii]
MLLRFGLLLCLSIGLGAAASARVSVGISVGHPGYWGNHYWANRVWQPHGRCNLTWHDHRLRSSRWASDRDWPRYRVDQPPQPIRIAPLSARTIHSQLPQDKGGALATLPANARSELHQGQRLYRWQQRCYRLNHSDQRYHPLECP